jgi:hypothetical protein
MSKTEHASREEARLAEWTICSKQEVSFIQSTQQSIYTARKKQPSSNVIATLERLLNLGLKKYKASESIDTNAHKSVDTSREKTIHEWQRAFSTKAIDPCVL